MYMFSNGNGLFQKENETSRECESDTNLALGTHDRLTGRLLSTAIIIKHIWDILQTSLTSLHPDSIITSQLLTTMKCALINMPIQ